MASPSGSNSVCKGCGDRRGTDHCRPNVMGMSLYLFDGRQPNPSHPCNNGQLDEIIKSLKNKKLDPISSLSEDKLQGLVLYPGLRVQQRELAKRTFKASRRWLRLQLQKKNLDEIVMDLTLVRQQEKVRRQQEKAQRANLRPPV